jgi:hypothetical protein
MRAMRACTIATAVFLGLLSATLGVAACSSGSTPPQPPPTGDAVPVTTSTIAPLPMVAATDAPKAKPLPKTAADCKVILSEITNEPPDGGIALNNAQTSGDAGATDRMAPLTELIKSKRDGFRCCFDVWVKDHPGTQSSAKLTLKLKPDGSVMSVGFADAPNRVPEVEACIGDLAKSLSYPRSPSGKETTFHYPFDFKARR